MKKLTQEMCNEVVASLLNLQFQEKSCKLVIVEIKNDMYRNIERFLPFDAYRLGRRMVWVERQLWIAQKEVC